MDYSKMSNYYCYESMSIEDLYELQEEISDKIETLEMLRKEVGAVISHKCTSSRPSR